MAADKLYFALNVSNNPRYPRFGLLQFLVEGVSEQLSEFTALHGLVRFFQPLLVLGIIQAEFTFQLFANEAIMCEWFILMKPLLAKRRTVERRQRFLSMFAFTLGSMQISKARPAVGLLILWAVILRWSYFAIGADDFIWVPVFPICDYEFSVVLPLVLSWIPHHVIMSKNGQFLVSWTHINCIELPLILQEILSRQTLLFYTRQCLRNRHFHQQHSILFIAGILKVEVDSSCPKNQVFTQAVFDAGH